MPSELTDNAAPNHEPAETTDGVIGDIRPCNAHNVPFQLYIYTEPPELLLLATDLGSPTTKRVPVEFNQVDDPKFTPPGVTTFAPFTTQAVPFQ